MRIYRSFIISFLFISLLFNSCSDYEPTEKTFLFTGQITASGAVPSEIAQTLNDQARSALPEFSNPKYFAYAVNKSNSKKVEAEFKSTSGNTKPFSIKLTYGVWIIECGLNVTVNKQTVKVFSASKEINVTGEVDELSNMFVLQPVKDGSGEIDLSIASSDSFDQIKLENIKKDGVLLTGGGLDSFKSAVEVSNTPLFSIKTKENTSLPCGLYEITINFLNGGFNVYSLTQSVSVFNGLITNNWVASGNLTIAENGGLQLTDDDISSFADTNIYVGSVSISGNTVIGSDDTGTGSAYAPYSSLYKAFEKIQKVGKSSDNYTVRVSGSLKGNVEIPETLTSSSASSVLITGFNAPGSDGNPVDILDGNSETCAVAVKSKVPVHFKNIKVTGAASNGAGLVIGDGTNVTFEGGVLVTGNGSVDILSDSDFSVKEFSSLGNVRLAENKKLVICGNLGNSGTVATFDLLYGKRRSLMLAADGTNVTDVSAYKNRFAVEDGWSLSETGVIESPIYVAGPENYDICKAPGSDDNYAGSKKYPFATISKAVSLMDDSTIDYTIKVAGVLKDFQCIPVTLRKDGKGSAKAKSVTLLGTSQVAKIDRGLKDKDPQSNGNCLTIATDVPVTILQMCFENGNNNGNGGGIIISNSSADVILGDGTVINGCDIKNNKATNGGGIYNTGILKIKNSVNVSNNSVSSSGSSSSDAGGIYSIKNLVMEGGSVTENAAGGTNPGDGGGVLFSGTFEMKGGVISGNTANSRGGGIYNNGGNFFMSGTAVIGDISKTSVADNAGKNYSNAALGGAGGAIYNCQEGEVYIGYTDKDTKADNNTSIGIGYNWAKDGGGGIRNIDGSAVHLSRGVICYNGSGTKGGTPSTVYSTGISNAGTLYMGGSAYFSNNDIYLEDNKTVTLDDYLTTKGTVLTVSDYSEKKVINDTTQDGSYVKKYCSYFSLNSLGNTACKINCLTDYGALVKSETIDGKEYAKYTADSSDNIVKFFTTINENIIDTSDIAIVMSSDITISGSNWKPIGYTYDDEGKLTKVPFKGIFDGNGKTLKISDNESDYFCTVLDTNEGIIQNLKLESSLEQINFNTSDASAEENLPISAHRQFSGFCYTNKGIIRNCWSAINSVGESTADNGGFCATNFGTIINCVNTGNIQGEFKHYKSSANSYQPYASWNGVYAATGGICGCLAENGKVENCINYGKITCKKSYDSHTGINGLGGSVVGYSNSSTNIISNCFWLKNCLYNSGDENASNLMLCKNENYTKSLIRGGTITANGYFESSTGNVTPGGVDECGYAQTISANDKSLKSLLNNYVNGKTGLVEWKEKSVNGTTYLVPSVFN